MIAASALTPRQIEVLAVYIRLGSRKEAAAELGLSLGTVRDHLAQCRCRLGVDTTMQAAVKATALGIVDARACVPAA